ncbi:hypothetical protein [Paracoccus sp. NSM]|uniref:hypothetical protein n=1 Tax=Paracoccus sp. NSM TaxID=3457784 RepID=UPI0040358EA9
MFRLRLPAALAVSLLTWPALADDMPQLCPLRSDDSSCSRVVACLGDEGRWFHGRALGRGRGEVLGVTSDGAQCRGQWAERGLLGLGQASVTCQDGTEVGVLFTYQDRFSGTATGRGTTRDGTAVQVWAGQHVLSWLESETGRPLGLLPCGPEGMLLSRARPANEGNPHGPHAPQV